jgi:predicted MFS family arabinose efflux permease
MIVADTGRALLLATIPLAAVCGLLRIEHLYVVGLCVGALMTLFTVSYASFVPSVVGREHLVEGNSKLAVSSQTAGIVGPSLAGALVQLITAPLAIIVDACTFLISAACLVLNPVREPSPAQRTVRSSVRAEIVQGFRFVWKDALIRPMCLSTGTFNLFGGVYQAVFLLYVTRQLDIEPAVLGVAYGIAGGSGLLGAAIAGRLTILIGIGSTLLGTLMLTGLSVQLLPFAQELPSLGFPLMVCQLSAFALGAVVYSIIAVSLLQDLTPERMIGRMTATTRVIATGATPFGALAGGALGSVVGLQATLWIASVGMLLAIPWLWLSPVRTLRRMPAAETGVIAGA